MCTCVLTTKQTLMARVCGPNTMHSGLEAAQSSSFPIIRCMCISVRDACAYMDAHQKADIDGACLRAKPDGLEAAQSPLAATPVFRFLRYRFASPPAAAPALEVREGRGRAADTISFPAAANLLAALSSAAAALTLLPAALPAAESFKWCHASDDKADEELGVVAAAGRGSAVDRLVFLLCPLLICHWPNALHCRQGEIPAHSAWGKYLCGAWGQILADNNGGTRPKVFPQV